MVFLVRLAGKCSPMHSGTRCSLVRPPNRIGSIHFFAAAPFSTERSCHVALFPSHPGEWVAARPFLSFFVPIGGSFIQKAAICSATFRPAEPSRGANEFCEKKRHFFLRRDCYGNEYLRVISCRFDSQLGFSKYVITSKACWLVPFVRMLRLTNVPNGHYWLASRVHEISENFRDLEDRYWMLWKILVDARNMNVSSMKKKSDVR